MPRFFFHFRTEGGCEQDEIGIEFADLETAYLDAFTAAREISQEMLYDRQDPTLYAFEITDESGVVLMELPFQEVLDPARGLRVGLGAPRTASGKAIHARRLSGELAAQIRTACAAIQRSQEILQRSHAHNRA